MAELASNHAPATPPAEPEAAPTAGAWDRSKNLKVKEVSAFRNRAVSRYEEVLATGRSSREAATIVKAELGVSRGSIRRWSKRARKAGDADPLDALLDRRGGGGDVRRVWEAPSAERAFGIYRRDYLRLEKPGSAACWRRVEKLGRARGWQIPSEQAFRARLHRDFTPFEIILAREGLEALDALYPSQQRTVANLAVMDWLSGDGRRHDLFVRMPDGRIVRPVTWVWQEVKTRKLVGWDSGETENADVVRLAFVRMVDRVGAPRVGVVVDSTRAASNRWFSTNNKRGWTSDSEELPGMMELLAIRVVRTRLVDAGTKAGKRKRKGSGQSKPVERAFRDLVESIDKHPLCAGAYTGPDPNAKTENYQSTAVPWETFRAVRDEAIREYNARPGRRTEIAARRSIDEAWREELAYTPIRRLTAEQRALMLLAVESTKVKPDGTFTLAAGKSVGISRNRYFGEALADGQRKKVVIRFDPQALHGRVQCFELDGKTWLCEADILDPAGFADTEAAREHGRARAGWKRGLKKALKEKRRAHDLAEEHGVVPVEREEPAVPAIVEGEFGDRATRKRKEEREDRINKGLRIIHGKKEASG